jgi:hypothetical protein
MKWKNINLRKGLYFLSALILLAGAAGAALIYRAAMNDSAGGAGYEVIGGYIYPGPSENSKRYIHDLQLYGGNAAVLADGFMRWFGGLWHGTSLAYTVAFIALFLSFVVFVVANNVPSRLTTSVTGENNRTKADE